MTLEQALANLKALVDAVGLEYGSNVDKLVAGPVMRMLYESLKTIEDELKNKPGAES